VRLNADLGEGMAFDAQLMPLIDMANIACGGHAGDTQSMLDTVRLAKRHGVQIGAHPSYPDKANFGRHSMVIPRQELLSSLALQIQSLVNIAKEFDVTVSYIKPHGALYNDMMVDASLLKDILSLVAQRFAGMQFMLLSTPDFKDFNRLADLVGVTLIHEVFADRAYQDSGALVPRSQVGACLSYDAAVEQVRGILQGQIISQSARVLDMPFDSLCVHGDNPEALQLVEALTKVVRA